MYVKLAGFIWTVEVDALSWPEQILAGGNHGHK